MKDIRIWLTRIKKGASLGWNTTNRSKEIAKYESSILAYIINISGAIATGYLLRYNVLGYDIYLIYLAIFIAICHFLSHGLVSIDRWIVINNLLKHKDFDLKNPELDQLEIRSARFAICAKALILQIKPLWTILGLILGYNLTEKPPKVEEKIIDLIKSPFSEIEKNNKDIKEITKLIKTVAEWGTTDDCMKKDAFEIIKELDKQKADMVKSNCNLREEILDRLKSNCIKKSK